MSHLDSGKSAKKMGATHPSVARRLDPAPPVARTPGKAAGKKVRRNFSYTYDLRRKDGKDKWENRTHWTWYATAKQRDDAMRSPGGPYRSQFYEIRNVTPITRQPDKPGAQE